MAVFGKITNAASADTFLDALKAYWSIMTNVLTLGDKRLKLKTAADALSFVELVLFIGMFLRIVQMIIELVRRAVFHVGQAGWERSLFLFYFFLKEFFGVCAASTSYVIVRLMHFLADEAVAGG